MSLNDGIFEYDIMVMYEKGAEYSEEELQVE